MQKFKQSTHDTFFDPEVTDSQGRQVGIECKTTSWGGFIMYVKDVGAKDYAVFTGSAYKRFLAWMVTR